MLLTIAVVVARGTTFYFHLFPTRLDSGKALRGKSSGDPESDAQWPGLVSQEEVQDADSQP